MNVRCVTVKATEGEFAIAYYVFNVKSTGLYVCCHERLYPFARLVVEESAEKFRYIFLMGGSGRLYCYDFDEDAVFFLANDLTEFGLRGLRRMDSMYMSPGVRNRIRIGDDPCKDLDPFSCRALAKVVSDNHGKMYSADPVFGTLDDTFMFWDRGFRGIRIWDNVAHRIANEYTLLGIMGCRDPHEDDLYPRLIVLVDACGAVYGYEDDLSRLCRLADSVCMFWRISSQKSIRNFRFCRRNDDIRRLEKAPRCPHACGVDVIRERVRDDGSEEEKGENGEDEGWLPEGGPYEAVYAYQESEMMYLLNSAHMREESRVWPEEVLSLKTHPAYKRAFEGDRGPSCEEGEVKDPRSALPHIFAEPCQNCVHGRREAHFYNLWKSIKLY